MLIIAKIVSRNANKFPGVPINIKRSHNGCFSIGVFIRDIKKFILIVNE